MKLLLTVKGIFFSDSEHKHFTYSCSFVKRKVLRSESRSVVSNSLCPSMEFSRAQNTGVGSHSLLQWIFIKSTKQVAQW